MRHAMTLLAERHLALCAPYLGLHGGAFHAHLRASPRECHCYQVCRHSSCGMSSSQVSTARTCQLFTLRGIANGVPSSATTCYRLLPLPLSLSPSTAYAASSPHTGQLCADTPSVARSPAKHALQKECRHGNICAQALVRVSADHLWRGISARVLQSQKGCIERRYCRAGQNGGRLR